MRHETVFRVTNSRYHTNPSSDRVFVRRRCNGSIFPWRSVAHYWAKKGTNHNSEAKCSAQLAQSLLAVVSGGRTLMLAENFGVRSLDGAHFPPFPIPPPQ